MVEQLNYSLFNQKRPKNKPYASYIGMQYFKNPQDFKKVPRPTYMPAYSSGRLFQGKMLEHARRRDTTFFHITSNGYVEYRSILQELNTNLMINQHTKLRSSGLNSMAVHESYF